MLPTQSTAARLVSNDAVLILVGHLCGAAKPHAPRIMLAAHSAGSMASSIPGGAA